MAIVSFFILPAVYLIIAVVYSIKHRKTLIGQAMLYSLVCFLISVFLGSVLIFSSRGSTAGVGFLFLPLYSLLPATLGFGLKAIQKKIIRVGLLLCLLSFYGFEVYETYKTQEGNRRSDQEQARKNAEFAKNRKWVREIEQSGPKLASRVLKERAESTDDRAVLIPIASSKMAPVELLIRLSKSLDDGIVLTVVRNHHTPSKALEDIYSTRTYPGYIFYALASNPNTPTKILFELFEQRDVNLGIETALAENPAAPMELLEKILESKYPLALANITLNPKADCSQIIQAHDNIKQLDPDLNYLKTAQRWAQPPYDKCKDGL